MSKKNSKPGKYSAKKQKNRGAGFLLVILVAVVLLVGGVLTFANFRDTMPEEPENFTLDTTGAATTATASMEAELPKETTVNLGYGIYVTDIGSYTGMYMEDGSDEILSNILMMVVKNDGDQDIQYAEITLDVNGKKAEFSLTTLPVGKCMVLLEKNRLAYEEGFDYSSVFPMANNVAHFSENINAAEDRLEIQIQDGVVNVTNISEEDIPGKITVYYKNAADDLYYGGITYRFSLEGGLKANEIRQVMTNHASETGSEIVFVTFEQ